MYLFSNQIWIKTKKLISSFMFFRNTKSKRTYLSVMQQRSWNKSTFEERKWENCVWWASLLLFKIRPIRFDRLAFISLWIRMTMRSKFLAIFQLLHKHSLHNLNQSIRWNLSILQSQITIRCSRWVHTAHILLYI